MSAASDADLLNIFWTEVSDYLQTLNTALMQIETGAADDEALVMREMNRVAHSMKGAARAVGVNVIETIAYYLEEIFERTASRRLELSPAVCDLLYDGLDLIQNVVNGQENSTEALATVLARLEQLVAAKDGAPASQPKHVPPRPAPEPSPASEVAELKAVTLELGALTNGQKAQAAADSQPVPRAAGGRESGDTSTLVLRPAEESIRVPVSKLDRLIGEISELLVIRMHGEERQHDLARLQKLVHQWQREWRAVRTVYIRLVRRLQSRGGDDQAAELAELLEFLDANQRYLMDANRQLTDLGHEMTQFNSQLGLLAEQLQADVGRMRLVPFESVLGGFQRMVRDLARDMNKNVFLDITGSTVEFDKTTLEALKEPIMHLLRNAVDHGLEAGEERERAGKPPTGRIQLVVEQRGKEIVVRVSDDGRGLDAARIGQAALNAGLLTPQELGALTPEEIYNFIFHPGLTTSEQVTAISGRGMGMDIVRARVEGLRGRVTVHSVPGQGTTFNLSVPLSLTRISCVLLRVGGQDFAIPSAMVGRMLKLPRDQVFTAEGRDMVMILDQPMPLVPMHAILNLPAQPPAETAEEITLLVLTDGERSVALEVDALYSEQELVLKPLGREIKQARFVSGAALLGTGDILIVLDGNDLIRTSTGLNLPHRRILTVEDIEPLPARQAIRVLVVDDSITTRTLEKHILETAGFQVTVAIDGQEAWAKLTEQDFDLVISDVEMPNINGLELTRLIKNTSATQHLPVILLTSLAKPEQREAGLRVGADAYLVKSQFDQAELLRVIQVVI